MHEREFKKKKKLKVYVLKWWVSRPFPHFQNCSDSSRAEGPTPHGRSSLSFKNLLSKAPFSNTEDSTDSQGLKTTATVTLLLELEIQEEPGVTSSNTDEENETQRI